MPSKTSEYLPRPAICVRLQCLARDQCGNPTNFAHDLVVLQHAPGDVDAVVVPVRTRHLGVDIGVDARHTGRGAGSVDRQLGESGRKT